MYIYIHIELYTSWRLENKNLVFRLRNRSSLLIAQVGSSLLHGRNHGRWTANKDLGVFFGSCKLPLNHLFSDKPKRSNPLVGLGVLVENIVDLEVGVLGCKLVNVVLEKNVLVSNVGKNQAHVGQVLGVANNGTDDLQHGGNTSSTGNHANVLDHVGLVLETALGALDLDGLVERKIVEVSGNVTLGVGLDQKLKMALVVFIGNGSVGSGDLLTVNVGTDGNVLANWETKPVSSTGKAKPVNVGVGRNRNLVHERKLGVVLRVEDLFGT